MVIDGATLRDLDVLAASTPRGQTIWSLVGMMLLRQERVLELLEPHP